MPKKLLFITSNRLGDAVLSTGLLGAALERFAPTQVTIACGPIPAPLFRAVPKLQEVILLDKAKGGQHWLDLWAQTVRQRWDVVIDLRNSIVSYLIISNKTFRFTGSRANEPKAAQLARVLKLDVVPPSKIWLDKAAIKDAMQLMGSDGPVLALCPTANWGPKQWPAQNFIKCAQALMQTSMFAGGRVAIFGAASERTQSQPIIDALSGSFPIIDLVGKTDPLQAAACLSLAQLCVANDSGLMHSAAAMGVPTIGLFGPSSDREYGPHGPRVEAVRGAPFYGLEKTPDPAALMQAISVESVVEAAKKLL